MFDSRSVESPSAVPSKATEWTGVRPELSRPDYAAVAYEIAELVGGVCVVHVAACPGKRLEPCAWHQAGGGAAWLTDFVASMQARPGEGVLGGVAVSGAAQRSVSLTLEEARGLPCDPSALVHLAPSGKLSLLCVPLFNEGEVVGTCTVFKEHGGRPYSEEELVLVQALVKRAARLRQMHERWEGAGRERQGGGLGGGGDFRSALDAAHALIWVGDVSRRCVYGNERWLAFTGRALDEALGEGWLESIHPDDRRPFLEAYAAAAERETSFEAEFRLRRFNGAYRRARCQVSPRFAPDGDFAGYVGVCTDVTEQHRREEERDHVSRAVESASDAVYVADRGGALVYHNRAFLDLLRYTPADLDVGGGPRVTFTRAEVAREVFSAAEQGRSWSGEVELECRDGRVVPVFVHADAVLDQEGAVIGVMGVCTDVTERRLAQEVVKESVELFRATFEQAAVGVAQVAPDGRILQANEKLCRLVGYAREELIGTELQALAPPDAPGEPSADFARFLAGETGTCTRERRVARKGGAPVWVSEVASWVRDGAQRPKYFITLVQDISDRKASEEALKESEKRLALMLQQTPALIWSTDEEMRLTRLMGAGLRARAAAPHPAPGVPAALVHARTSEALPFEVPRESQRRALGGESVPFEMEAGGRVYQSRIEPFRDADGAVKGVIGVATDVTERRRMHDALIESEERYRSFVATISEAIWCWELDVPLPVNLSIALQVRHIYQNARMVECNEVYAREIAGKPLGDVVGQRIRDLFALLPERFQFFSDFIRSGYRIRSKRYSDVDAHGKRRYYVANVAGIQENDRLVRIWGSRIDATETVDVERQVLNALERQQQRIGHDLHDSVGQLLTAVRMLSEQLAEELSTGGDREAALAEKIASFAQDALQQTRRVYRGLAPVMLQTEGLLTTLRDLAHNLDTLPDVTCTFTSNTEAEVGDPDAWIHMYRIVQEGAHNAIKHGHCKRLWLSLTSLKSKIVLSVRDDGQGFDPADAQGGGIGLSGMRYRAGLIGAVLEVESKPGEGTTLTCTIPPGGSGVLEA